MTQTLDDDKMLTIRMPNTFHKNLRKLSYLTQKPMAELVRNGIEMVIENNKKVLTNSDIVIS